jgi:ArsR family metal-binding transcriptional regulator
MEVLIAILWFLQVIFTNSSYTTEQIDMMYIQNQQMIETIQQDQQLTNQIVTDFNTANDWRQEGNVVEIYEGEESEPIIK